MRIAPGFDQSGSGFDRLAKPQVGVWDAQQLPAGFVEFNDPESKGHRILSARQASLIPQCFNIRQSYPCHAKPTFTSKLRIRSLIADHGFPKAFVYKVFTAPLFGIGSCSYRSESVWRLHSRQILP